MLFLAKIVLCRATRARFFFAKAPRIGLKKNGVRNYLPDDRNRIYSSPVASSEEMSEIRTCDESYPVRTKQTNKESSQQQIK